MRVYACVCVCGPMYKVDANVSLNGHKFREAKINRRPRIVRMPTMLGPVIGKIPSITTDEGRCDQIMYLKTSKVFFLSDLGNKRKTALLLVAILARFPLC